MPHVEHQKFPKIPGYRPNRMQKSCFSSNKKILLFKNYKKRAFDVTHAKTNYCKYDIDYQGLF